MPKYTTPEEDAKIKAEYASGEYTYEQLGGIHRLSKATIINIVRGYPFGGVCGHRAGKGNRVEFKQRMYRSLQTSIEAVASKVDEQRRSEALHDTQKAQLADQQFQLIYMITGLPPDQQLDRLKEIRLQTEQQAWEAIASGNIIEYCTLSSLWQTTTDIVGDFHKNPFSEAINCKLAKDRSKSIRFSKIAERGKQEPSNECECQSIDADQTEATGCYHVPDEVWEQINDVAGRANKRNNEHGRDKRILEGLFLAIQHDLSLKDLGRMGIAPFATIQWYYNEWYRYGVFGLLRELSITHVSIRPYYPILSEIERQRLVDPTHPPTIQDAIARFRAKK